jgi:hypothetical protein
MAPAVQNETGAATELVLRLSARMAGRHGRAVQVEVWDAASALPRPGREAPPDEPGGWGLVLVESVSQRWGSYPTPGGGKIVPGHPRSVT